MSRATSPLRDRMVFVVGARRSGTNWLQRMLAAHPAVLAVPSETYLFAAGIRPLSERFHHGAASSPGTGVVWMDRERMLDALRDLCDQVFLGLREALGPGAERIVERTPDHVRCLDLIGDVYPDAWVVHIVRDGRDVVRSLLAQEWGPARAEEAAEEWRSAVEAARRAAPGLARYREVRYEDLLADPARHVGDLLAWLGLEAPDEVMEGVLAEARTPFNVDPGTRRPGAGKWQTGLAPEDLAAVTRVAGPLLEALGYGVAGGRERGGSSRPSSTAPAPSALPRPRRGLRMLRWALRAGPSFRRWAHLRIQEQQALVDRFLGAIGAARFADAAAMLGPRASVRIVSAEGEWRGRGRAARERLERTLASDPALRGRQRRADLHPGLPTHAVVASYELDDGSVEHRVLVLLLRRHLVEAVTYYRIPGHGAAESGPPIPSRADPGAPPGPEGAPGRG
jgi:hypothetical protein